MMPQSWGEGWRWIVYAALIVLVPFSSLFLLGLWALKLTPRSWWRSVWSGAPPEQYDGKEPHAQWAAKMEKARETQRREEE